MPTLDEEQFKAYLKQFRPTAPDPLPVQAPGHRAVRRLVLWVGGVAALVVLAGMLALHSRRGRPGIGETSRNLGNPGSVAAQPLTARNTAALLAKAPSFQALLDDVIFRSETPSFPKGKRSAVAVLSQEKVKL